MSINIDTLLLFIIRVTNFRNWIGLFSRPTASLGNNTQQIGSLKGKIVQ